ncbi:MAG: LTA synthase family protein, partial [Atopobiaceae bacterium]|nr:LTA synthase family protein [Atopobiaceae bacterium]
MLFVIPFSAAIGQLVYLLASIAKDTRTNAIIKQVVLAVLPIMYGVLFFVRSEFGVYYDLSTITHGAGGVVGQFLGDVLRLVFSVRGIVAIILFLLPAILFWPLIRERFVSCKRIKSRARIRIGISYVAAHLVGLLLVSISGPFGLVYSSRYNFDTAIQNFGLLTGVRLDFFKGADTSLSFEEVSFTPADDVKTANTSDVYGVSALDIDFNALAESTGDETLRNLDYYIASLTPSSKNAMTGRCEGYNLIVVCAEAFSAEVIDPVHTPALYRMATRGIQFNDYYQFAGAGTQGGESQTMFGVLCTEGADTMDRSPYRSNYWSLGYVFNRQGYNGWAFHNNHEDYYNRVFTHNHLGFSNGFLAMDGGMEQWVDYSWPESDEQMFMGTFDNIYGNEASEPFLAYYMTVSGHSVYLYDNHAMARKNWDKVADQEHSDPVKVYLAGNYDLELAMEFLLNRLEETGMADHTLVVITADHYPYGLTDVAALGDNYLSDLYGYSPQDSFQRDHNRLIMWSGSFEESDPIVVDTPVSSIDIMPTLCNLFGIEWDSRLYPGRDVFSDAVPVVFDLGYNWKSPLGTYYYGTFYPVEGVQIPENYVENMNSYVSNKMQLCRGILVNDYYRHVFGDPEDVQAAHDRGV